MDEPRRVQRDHPAVVTIVDVLPAPRRVGRAGDLPAIIVKDDESRLTLLILLEDIRIAIVISTAPFSGSR